MVLSKDGARGGGADFVKKLQEAKKAMPTVLEAQESGVTDLKSKKITSEINNTTMGSLDSDASQTKALNQNLNVMT